MSAKVSRYQAGFTLIEVLLFLAITGLLFLIGFWGTSTQLRNVRFSDSMHSLESYLNTQHSLVASGANPRQITTTCSNPGGGPTTPPTFGSGGSGTTAGNSVGCVLLGKLVVFTANGQSVKSYYVAGKKLATFSGDDITDIVNSAPTLTDQAVDTYGINWGNTFLLPGSVPATNMTQVFAFLRSPSSGKIISFAFPTSMVDSSIGPGSASASLRVAGVLSSANLAKNSGYCFKDGFGHEAIIQLAPDQQGNNFKLTFDQVHEDVDCVRSK